MGCDVVPLVHLWAPVAVMLKVPDIRPLHESFRRRGGLALVIWLGLMLGLLFPYFESTRNANELPRLIQGMALSDEGSWAIDGPAARGLPVGPDVSRSTVDGRLYPNKPPGTTLVAAAAYRIARLTSSSLDLRTYTFWARLLGGVLPALLLAGFMFRRYAGSFGGGVAATAVLLYALGTPAASYAHLLYGHALAALFLFTGVSMLLDAGGDEDTRSVAARRACLGGALAGSAVAVEYGAVFAALPIAVLLFARSRRRHGLVVLGAAVVGALLPVILLGAYHQAVFGSPWSTGYHHVTNADFAQKHGQGLLGLGLPKWSGFSTHMLSMDGGLLWWAPTVVIAIYGLAHLSLDPAAEERTEARLHLGVFALYVVIVSSLSFEGGWRVGPRYLVAVLPSLCIGWARVLLTMRTHPMGMLVLTALATYSVVVNGLAANLWPHFDLTNINSPVAEVLLPLWDHDREPYDVLRWATGYSALRMVVVGSVVSVWVLLFRTAEGGYSMAGGILLGAVIGLLLVDATQHSQPHSMGKRNLAYIERIWEPKDVSGPPSAGLPEKIGPAQTSRTADESNVRPRRPSRRRTRAAPRGE